MARTRTTDEILSIREIEDKLSKYKAIKDDIIRIEGKIKAYQETRKDIIAKIEKLGVKPEDIESEIDALKRLIQEDMSKLDELIRKVEAEK